MTDEQPGEGSTTFEHSTGRRAGLTREDLAWMRASGDQIVLRRGALFCQAGDTDCRCGMLVDGVLQVYALSKRGRRVALDLVFPGAVVLPVGGSDPGVALATIEAVTHCILRVWPASAGRVVPGGRPDGQHLWVRVAENALRDVRQRYLATRILNAEERFARMAAELPDAWRQLPQHVIASYLGITPQYLSRIKRGSGSVA